MQSAGGGSDHWVVSPPLESHENDETAAAARVKKHGKPRLVRRSTCGSDLRKEGMKSAGGRTRLCWLGWAEDDRRSCFAAFPSSSGCGCGCDTHRVTSVPLRGGRGAAGRVAFWGSEPSCSASLRPSRCCQLPTRRRERRKNPEQRVTR